MRTFIFIIISTLFISCSDKEYLTDTTLSVDKSFGQDCSVKVVRTYRAVDHCKISELKMLYNFNDAKSISRVTGIKKQDGYRPIEVDSIFYADNDTLTKGYLFKDNTWQKGIWKNQVYRPDNQPDFFNIKFHTNGMDRKIFYRYDKSGRLLSEVQVEKTDSVHKKIYYYTKNNSDSTAEFIYKKNGWVR